MALEALELLCRAQDFPESLLGKPTLPSLNVDLDPGGYLEDLGLILGILAIMVSSI